MSEEKKSLKTLARSYLNAENKYGPGPALRRESAEEMRNGRSKNMNSFVQLKGLGDQELDRLISEWQAHAANAMEGTARILEHLQKRLGDTHG